MLILQWCTVTRKHTQCAQCVFVYEYFLLCVKGDWAWEWLSLFLRPAKREWEMLQRERKSALSLPLMCVRVCWRSCCLPSITPSLCPQVTQTHWDDCQELGLDAPRHFCDTVSVMGGATGSLTHRRARLLTHMLWWLFLSLLFYSGTNMHVSHVCATVG